MKITKSRLKQLIKEELHAMAISEVTAGGGGSVGVEPISPDVRKKAADAAYAKKEKERTSPANFAKRIQALEDKIYRLEKHKPDWQDVEKLIAEKLKTTKTPVKQPGQWDPSTLDF